MTSRSSSSRRLQSAPVRATSIAASTQARGSGACDVGRPLIGSVVLVGNGEDGELVQRVADHAVAMRVVHARQEAQGETGAVEHDPERPSDAPSLGQDRVPLVLSLRWQLGLVGDGLDACHGSLRMGAFSAEEDIVWRPGASEVRRPVRLMAVFAAMDARGCTRRPGIREPGDWTTAFLWARDAQARGLLLRIRTSRSPRPPARARHPTRAAPADGPRHPRPPPHRASPRPAGAP